jgi:hypothetical protein
MKLLLFIYEVYGVYLLACMVAFAYFMMYAHTLIYIFKEA